MTRSRFLAADWPAPGHVVAGTSVRGHADKDDPYSSFNLGAHVGDSPQRVVRNRKRLFRDLGLPAEPLWLRQVHGCNVARAPATDAEPEADASVTDRPDAVCAVLTADCLPVLFCNLDGTRLGAAHAGWRGLCDGVLEAAVAALDCEPATVMAWFGPAISQDAFEVGEEVRLAFVGRQPSADACFQPNARGRWQADLYALARLRLERLGVTRIYGGDRCTYRESEAFYSYRRDGHCGRMASLVFRRAH